MRRPDWPGHSRKVSVSRIEARQAHYTRHFGPLTELIVHSTDAKDVHIDIYRFRPTDERPFWTLITGGMSDRRQRIPPDADPIAPRAEILLYAHAPENWMFGVLKVLAELPFEQRSFLHWYHTVKSEEPMIARAPDLTSFIFLPPYLEKPAFNTLRIGGDKVDMLWVIPITERERQYAIINDGLALEERLRLARLSRVIDEGRKSVV